MTLEPEDVFAASGQNGGQKQVAFQEIDMLSRGDDGASIIRCNSDAVACVQPGWLHLFRSKDKLESWPMEEAVLEVAVSKQRIATALQEGQLVVWRELQGQLVEEARIVFPEPISVTWCPGERHVLCYGRHVEAFLFLVEGLTAGSCLDWMDAEIRHFSCEVKCPASAFITAAAFATARDLFGAASAPCLSLWRWASAVPALNAVPSVSLASSIRFDASEVLKLCFAPSEAGELLLLLCAEELRIFAFDADTVLTPKRVLCFGHASADVTSAGLLAAKGRSVTFVSLGDASSSFQATLPEAVTEVALGPGPAATAHVLVRRPQGEVPGRCCFLIFEPLLTKEMAIYLRQSYLKYWERSMAQLLRSCGKQVAGSLKAAAPKEKTSPHVEVLQHLLREVQGLQGQFQASQLGADSPSREADQFGLNQQAFDKLLPQVVEKLGERLADPEDGQLFHERFLAAFPVQGDGSLDELHRELHGFSQQLRNLLQAHLSEKMLQCCEQLRPSIWQYGCILTEALDDAVVQSISTIASNEAKQALERLNGSTQRLSSCTEELRQAAREALGGVVREAEEVAAKPTGQTLQLTGLRQCALPLQESLEQLAREVEETQESLRKVANEEQGGKKESNGNGISPLDLSV